MPVPLAEDGVSPRGLPKLALAPHNLRHALGLLPEPAA